MTNALRALLLAAVAAAVLVALFAAGLLWINRGGLRSERKTK